MTRSQKINQRHDTIRGVIAEYAITDQDTLLEKLKARGIASSQPVLSRDLIALRVSRVYFTGHDEPVYCIVPDVVF